MTTGRPIGFVPRGALQGLRLVATDLDWAWGGGALLEGRGIDLVMVACGRAVSGNVPAALVNFLRPL